MSLHVIVGAGPVGTATARHSRRAGRTGPARHPAGQRPVDPAIERVAADAADADRLTALTEGAVALYNCANPAYHRWATDWPPLAAALLTTAERTGAVLATVGCLYGYGPVDAPMTEDTPLAATGTKGRVRNRMWTEALAAHRAGRARITEVRGSDYLGAERQLPAAAGAAEGARRATGPPAGELGRPAQLDVHRGRGAHPGRRRHRRAGLGAGLARAQQPGRQRPRAGGPGGGNWPTPRRRG